MPSERFSVITDEGYSVLAALSTRLAREAWNIKVGDRVTMQLSIDLPVPGRIVRLATPRAASGASSNGIGSNGAASPATPPAPTDTSGSINPEET